MSRISNPRAQAALDAEVAAVGDAPEGTRNDKLNTAAYNLGQLVASGELDERWVTDRLTTAAQKAGLQELEISRTISSGLESGKRQPRSAPNGANARPPLRVLSRSDLRTLPEPTPLIDNVLDRGTIAHLYGAWGTGKSFIALDWGACVATGKPWQGRRVEQCRVLYVAAEGANGYDARADAWETGWRTKIPDESMSWLPEPVNLTKAGDVDRLRELIRDGGYGFVILDTLARCTVGAEENSNADMGIVIDAMTRLRDATPDGRGVIACCHHTGKDKKTSRGGSALEAGMDTIYFIEADGPTLTLTRTKRKDGPKPDQHRLELEPVADSCIVSSARGTIGEQNPLRPIASQVCVPPGINAGELKKIAIDEFGVGRSTYYRKLADLLESGELTNVGTTARPVYQWLGARGGE